MRFQILTKTFLGYSLHGLGAYGIWRGISLLNLAAWVAVMANLSK